MFYVGNCPCCDQGLLGIRICCEDEIGLIVCDECEAIWLEPARCTPAIFTEQPDSRCPRCDRPIWQPPSHWAAADEVERLGWQREVVGEFPDESDDEISSDAAES